MLSLLGAGSVFVVCLLVLTWNGPSVVSWAVFMFGTLALAVVVFDYPIASTFGPDAVVRRAMFRRHRIEWDRVDQLTRSRPSIIGGFRGLRPGGLVAKIGRRRYLLVDQCESLAEFEELSAVLHELHGALAIDEMIVPPAATDPTWTYRRSRWGQGSG